MSGSTTLTVAGGDLYRIAAEQYGDASLFVQLMEANGLTDPVLPAGLTQIVLPAGLVSTDGVPNG